MTAVCIPLADEEACLRITMVMGVSGEPSHVSGSVVAPDCVVDPDADVLVDNFDGTAFTGHGGLWMTGVASLDDGSARELDIEAGLGDCEI
ncbi:MAG: hypothetical protein K0V04_35640 [Deltaproteobacteria bacterium]|nr:hypothetical protein [Deltaproteobacteria bacterium]